MLRVSKKNCVKNKLIYVQTKTQQSQISVPPKRSQAPPLAPPAFMSSLSRATAHSPSPPLSCISLAVIGCVLKRSLFLRPPPDTPGR